MTAEPVDCVVVGSGPGGYVAAIRAAQLGMKTVVVEKEPTVGGRCLNVACIPAKAVLRAADALSEVHDAAALGIRLDGAVNVDFTAVQERRHTVITTLTGGVGGLLSKRDVEVIHGGGRLQGADEVVVGDRTLRADKAIVLATGSVPKPLPGLALGGNVIGTEQAWALEQLPATMVVIGAGASGTEIASAYQRLGTQVTLYEELDRVLPTEDADISKVAARAFTQQGIDLRVGTRYEGQEADWIVVATGRVPDVEALGIEHLQRTADGLIAVDGAMRTSVDGIYAIGDLVPGPALAHKASDEGIIAVEDAAGRAIHPLAYVDIPRATFCAPNVGSFGLTEAQAREQGLDVVVGKLQYAAVGAGTIYGDRTGLVKVVGDATTGEILGGHIVGTRATELIQELVNVKLLEGGYPEVARMIHGHPTLSEAVLEAARAADGWLIHG